MMAKIFVAIIALGGGLTAGSAAAAFLALLEVIPRLMQISDTRDYIRLYQGVLTFGFTLFTLIYLSEFHLNLSKYVAIPAGFLYGMFIGIFSSALAEVLNVIPVLTKKLKLRDHLIYVIYTLAAGKVVGSIFYWVYMK